MSHRMSILPEALLMISMFYSDKKTNIFWQLSWLGKVRFLRLNFSIILLIEDVDVVVEVVTVVTLASK